MGTLNGPLKIAETIRRTHKIGHDLITQKKLTIAQLEAIPRHHQLPDLARGPTQLPCRYCKTAVHIKNYKGPNTRCLTAPRWCPDTNKIETGFIVCMSCTKKVSALTPTSFRIKLKTKKEVICKACGKQHSNRWENIARNITRIKIHPDTQKDFGRKYVCNTCILGWLATNSNCNAKMRITMQARYGKDHPSKIPTIVKKAQKKRKATFWDNAEKRASWKAHVAIANKNPDKIANRRKLTKEERATQQKKKARTMMRRYGVTSWAQTEDGRSNLRDSFRKILKDPVRKQKWIENLKLGASNRDPATYVVDQEAMRAGILKKFGVPSWSQTQEARELFSKIASNNHSTGAFKRGMQARYGVDYASQNGNVADKISDTMSNFWADDDNKKYMVDCLLEAASRPETKSKRANTNIERHGNACSLTAPQIREKSHTTLLRRYGYVCSFDKRNPNSEEVYNKAKATKLKNGTFFTCGTSRTYKGLHVDSNYEVQFIDLVLGLWGKDATIKRGPHIRYVWEGKNKVTQPDFVVTFKNKYSVLVEIKSNYTHNMLLERNKRKRKLYRKYAQDNNMNFCYWIWDDLKSWTRNFNKAFGLSMKVEDLDFVPGKIVKKPR